MSKKRKKRLLNINLPERAKLVIAASAGVALVVIVFVTVVALLNQPRSSEDVGLTADQIATRDKNVQQAKRDGAIRADALAAIKEGDAAEAEEVYAKAIASEEDTARKVQLYIDQSGVLYDAGNVKEAIAVAKRAEALTNDKYLIADWLSRLYEDQKKYKLAAEYYALAGEWATSETNRTSLDKEYYDSQAARVTALRKK